MTNWNLKSLAAILALTFSISGAYANAPATAASDEILPRLFTDPTVAVRQSNTTWPDDIAAEPVNLENNDRSPASAPAAKNRAPAKTQKAAPAARPNQSSNTGLRRSRLPASVTDGFELQVHYNKLTSMFWVMKRSDRQSLLFSNSSGSRASFELSYDNFANLISKAREFPSAQADISKCQDANMQMHIVTSGKERTFTACVNSKEKTAGRMRDFSQALASLVM